MTVKSGKLDLRETATLAKGCFISRQRAGFSSFLFNSPDLFNYASKTGYFKSLINPLITVLFCHHPPKPPHACLVKPPLNNIHINLNFAI